MCNYEIIDEDCPSPEIDLVSDKSKIEEEPITDDISPDQNIYSEAFAKVIDISNDTLKFIKNRIDGETEEKISNLRNMKIPPENVKDVILELERSLCIDREVLCMNYLWINLKLIENILI